MPAGGKKDLGHAKHEEGVGQGPHEFRRAGRIAGAIRDITYMSAISKVRFPRRHACRREKGLGTRQA